LLLPLLLPLHRRWQQKRTVFPHLLPLPPPEENKRKPPPPLLPLPPPLRLKLYYLNSSGSKRLPSLLPLPPLPPPLLTLLMLMLPPLPPLLQLTTRQFFKPYPTFSAATRCSASALEISAGYAALHRWRL
jgi:hypothetical protein